MVVRRPGIGGIGCAREHSSARRTSTSAARSEGELARQLCRLLTRVRHCCVCGVCMTGSLSLFGAGGLAVGRSCCRRLPVGRRTDAHQAKSSDHESQRLKPTGTCKRNRTITDRQGQAWIFGAYGSCEFVVFKRLAESSSIESHHVIQCNSSSKSAKITSRCLRTMCMSL